MGDITVVVPSMGRAGRVQVLRWLPTVTLFVPENEGDAYRRAYPDVPIETHHVTGLPATRNAVMRRFDDVFMIDDDVKEMRSMFTGPGEHVIRPTGDFAMELIRRLHAEATDLGVHLFGFCPFPHPLRFDPMKPYDLTGVVQSHAVGLRYSPKLFYSEELMAEDEYWMTCINAFHHRMALIDNRWCVVNPGAFKGSGGLANVRTAAVLERDLAILQRAFGDAIVLRGQGSSTMGNPHHEMQRTARIPFHHKPAPPWW